MLKNIYTQGRQIAKDYFNGTKFMYNQWKQTRVLKKKRLNGQKLNVLERKYLRFSNNELYRGIFPVVYFLLPYVGYGLPVLGHYYPQILPASFLNDKQKVHMFNRRQKARGEYSNKVMKKIGDYPIEIKCDKLEKEEEINKDAYNYIHNTHSLFSYRYLKFLVNDRFPKIRDSVAIVIEDDQELVSDQNILGQILSDINELRCFCEDRGIKILNEDQSFRGDDELRRDLSGWLSATQSLHQKNANNQNQLVVSYFSEMMKKSL